MDVEFLDFEAWLKDSLFSNHITDLRDTAQADLIRKDISTRNLRKAVKSGKTVLTKNLFVHPSYVFVIEPEALEKVLDLDRPVYFVDKEYNSVRFSLNSLNNQVSIILGSETQSLTGLEWYRACQIHCKLLDILESKDRLDLAEKLI